MKNFLIAVSLVASALPGFAQILSQVDGFILDAEYTKAISAIDASLEMVGSDERIALLNRKATTLIHLGKLPEAQSLLNQLLSESHVGSTQAAILTTLGSLYMNQGRNDKASETLKNALQILADENNENSLQAAEALTYLGQAYKFSGKETEAEQQLRMALLIREKLLNKDHELIAASYNDLGLVLTGVDNDKALEYYEKALEIYQTLHGETHPKIAIANTNIAFIYRELHLYGDAVNNFETTLKIWDHNFNAAHPSKAFTLLNLGITYFKMGDQKAAKGYYEKALDVYRQSYGNHHPDIANVLNLLGNLEIGQNRFESALKMYQGAIEANRPDAIGEMAEPDAIIKDYYNGNVLLYSLLYKAEAYEKQYFGKTLRFSDLATSLRIIELCDRLIEKLRQTTTNESDKITLGAIAADVYASGVRIAFEATQNALVKNTYKELCFYFAEKSKSAVLLEAITDTNAKTYAGIPPGLLEEEKELRSSIATVAQKLSQKPDVDEEKQLRTTAFKLDQQYKTFVANLEKTYPQYYNLKYNVVDPSINEIRSVLPANSALLSYFIDERNKRIYIFTITNRRLLVEEKTLPDAYDKYITGVRNAIYYNDEKTFIKAANALSDLVVPQLPGSIKELIIIPTGRISVIPFEALFTRRVKSEEIMQSLPYLVKKFAVQYEFAAALMLQKSQKRPAIVKPAIFLCAPITFAEQQNLPALPATESEVDKIANMFSEKKGTSVKAIGLEADESVIKGAALSKYSHLHFATHGIVDERDPELSRIFLRGNSGSDDGQLFAGEIYNLQLDADLVTLSACQTGLGKISKGEGVIGLSRALVYAGANKVIVSFWSVADESTSLLMTSFYDDYLTSSGRYSGSLRKAKLKMIANTKYASPFYWAPFILIGF